MDKMTETPKPVLKRADLRLEEDVHRRLHMQARQLGRTVQALITSWIRAELWSDDQLAENLRGGAGHDVR